MGKMKFIAIGRSSALYNSIEHLVNCGLSLVGILTGEEYDEYGHGISDFMDLGRHYNIPVKTCKSINSKIISWMENLNADIGISVNWKTFINSDARSIFQYGILNAHLGDLPRFRGNATPNWAIIVGETCIPITIHNMVDEIDAGAIWYKRYMYINNNTTISDILKFSHEETGPSFVHAINAIESNMAPSIQEGMASRCYPRIRQDGLINWSNSAVEIARLILAVSEPLSGAYTYIESEKLIIWKACILEMNEMDRHIVPGQIINKDMNRSSATVATMHGDLELLEVQLGEVRLPASKIIKSTRIRLGMAVEDEIEKLRSRMLDLEKLIENKNETS